MITNIKQENAEGTQYAATIGSKTWSGIREGSRHWEPLQEAIDAGAEVEPYPTPTLDDLKAEKIQTIDWRTAELIKTGFPFDGESFSMSEAAQRNWAALAAAKANDILSFPLLISTVDEGSYELADATACLQFLGAYMTYQSDPTQPLGLGRALKAQVDSCTTEAELEAVEDTR